MAGTIHEKLAEEIELSQAYAQDGAFISASNVLKRASKMLVTHHHNCLRGELEEHPSNGTT